jgi:hypothetical protein
MGSFQETIQRLVDGMNDHASKIEAAKLKALGQRNRVESEIEVRKRRTAEIQVRVSPPPCSRLDSDRHWLVLCRGLKWMVPAVHGILQGIDGGKPCAEDGDEQMSSPGTTEQCGSTEAVQLTLHGGRSLAIFQSGVACLWW